MYKLKDKKVGLSAELIDAIQFVGRKCNLDIIILFGSRARCSNADRSDIDLAIKVKNAVDYYTVIENLEEIDTLLIFDVVDMESSSFSRDLADEIKKDGVIIYEKV